MVSSCKHSLDWSRSSWKRERTVWQCEIVHFISILTSVPLQIFTWIKLDYCPFMCGIQIRIHITWGWNFFMDSKLHSFSGPEENQFFFSQGGYGEGQAVHLPTTLNHLLHSLVPVESHLSTYYCSQFISIQNIDHLLGN